MKKVLAVGLVTLLVSLMPVVPASATAPQHFSLVKVCDYAPDECGVQDATGPFAVLKGGVVKYLGPNVGTPNAHGLLKINSEVLLVSADGNSTLSGHFVFSGDQGHFTLYDGKGALTGITAQGSIGTISWEGWLFSLDGVYFDR